MFITFRLMKLSSPNLNYLIGFGAIVLYIGMYLFVIPSTNPLIISIFCNVRSITGSCMALMEDIFVKK